MKIKDKLIIHGCLFVGLFCALASAADSKMLACVGGTVYPSPTAAPVKDAAVLVEDGKITTVEAGARFKLPASAQVLDCKDKFIVAGFWNSHVHFEKGWQGAADAPADKLEAHMQEMLTHWGVTAVWDLGSLPSNTQAIRRRVESGEVPGPKIMMAGDIFPKGGHPVYLPPEMQLPEAATPQEAEEMTQGYMQMGMDGLKLFTGAYMGHGKPVINMDTAIVKAAVDVAHAQGKPAFAHPQNHVGVDNALNGGVDILAHTVPTEDGFTPEELAQMKKQHTALIPTLTLFTTVVNDPAIADVLVGAGVSELKAYFSQGGTVLFGTDVGFIQIYDTSQEYEFMARAMGHPNDAWKDILASLTTNPADYFKATTKGRVEKGMDADFVVLDADPATDVKNLAKVKYTVRGGKVIYQEK
jgi:imidazolonepropionase-like amidohydrolase